MRSSTSGRSDCGEEVHRADYARIVDEWLVSDGLPPNIVQRIMGHEDVTTTLSIYTDVPADYVDRVDDVFDDSMMTDEDKGDAS